jgi:hypothetical protein
MGQDADAAHVEIRREAYTATRRYYVMLDKEGGPLFNADASFLYLKRVNCAFASIISVAQRKYTQRGYTSGAKGALSQWPSPKPI